MAPPAPPIPRPAAIWIGHHECGDTTWTAMPQLPYRLYNIWIPLWYLDRQMGEDTPAPGTLDLRVGRDNIMTRVPVEAFGLDISEARRPAWEAAAIGKMAGAWPAGGIGCPDTTCGGPELAYVLSGAARTAHASVARLSIPAVCPGLAIEVRVRFTGGPRRPIFLALYGLAVDP